MNILSPQEIDEITRLLLRAVDFAQLRRFVRLATDEEFEVFIPENLALRDSIYRFIVKLEKAQITDQFLDVIYREKPFQFELRAFIAARYPGIAANEQFMRRSYLVQERGQDTARPMPGLERIVKGGDPYFDLRVWLDKMMALERQVCRIEAQGQALGTGFLVGENAVLTNWHVVQEARNLGIDKHLGCRFDFRRLTNGRVDGGSFVAVSTVPDERPCSQAELGDDPDLPPPSAGELDYALLELTVPQAGRGYVSLATETPVAPNGSLVIVQHPDGQEMRFAIDTQAIEGFYHEGRRLRYTTRTDPGSSGSPCFTMQLDIVALHHLGDPRRGPAKYNQGIPVSLIRKAIAQRPAAAALLGP